MASIHELFFLEYFVREKLKLKIKEVQSLHILEILRFVNFTPNSLNIILNDLSNDFFVVSSGIEISKDKKEEFFG
jgi:hypothetical protein